jgi:hypothetical protein
MVIAGNRIWNEMFAPNWMRERMSGSMVGSGCCCGREDRPDAPSGQSGVASREAERRRVPMSRTVRSAIDFRLRAPTFSGLKS